MNLDDYNHQKEYSITKRHHNRYGTQPILEKFEQLIKSLPYIESWSEYQKLDRNPKLLYQLEFTDSLNVTNQIYTSVVDHLFESKLEITILKQSKERIIIKVPELEKEVLDKWYYEVHGESRN